MKRGSCPTYAVFPSFKTETKRSLDGGLIIR